ncbi:MAG: hypothetical protein WC755_03995 [Candidatus Woesearchaeota archaeon]|jgi:hypothetical protein
MKKKSTPKKILKKGSKYLRMCPKCGGTNVSTDYSIPAAWDYGAPSNFKCNDCNFVGSIFPEINPLDRENIKKEFNKTKNKEKTISSDEFAKINFGRGLAKGIGKILGPIFLSIFAIFIYVFFLEKDAYIALRGLFVLIPGIFFTYAGYFSKKLK